MLKLDVKKLREQNNVFLNQQLQYQQDLETSKQIEQELRMEIAELKSIIEAPNKESLQQSFNLLTTKYENAKNDIANLHIQIEKLKTQVNKQLKENQRMSADLDEKTDALEMALIDKCMAEEQMEIQKEKEKELNERIEELSIELDLAQSYHFEPSQTSRRDVLQQDRLVEALIKLREVSMQKESELKEKLEERESDLKRLKRIEDSHHVLQENLKDATTKIEFLKVQLDDANDSSDLIHKLTETNLNLDEVYEANVVTCPKTY
jgi:hypothetical protein